MNSQELPWLKKFGSKSIVQKTEKEPKLGKALDSSLEQIYELLETTDREYELTGSITNSRENLIKLEVKYQDRVDRDKIWDGAAEIISKAVEKVDKKVNILCGIYRLR